MTSTNDNTGGYVYTSSDEVVYVKDDEHVEGEEEQNDTKLAPLRIGAFVTTAIALILSVLLVVGAVYLRQKKSILLVAVSIVPIVIHVFGFFAVFRARAKFVVTYILLTILSNVGTITTMIATLMIKKIKTKHDGKKERTAMIVIICVQLLAMIVQVVVLSKYKSLCDEGDEQMKQNKIEPVHQEDDTHSIV